MKKIVYLSIFVGIKVFCQVGINTSSPTNMLHIKGNGVSDALRIEGIRSGASNLENLVSTSSGIVKRQNLNTVSAVRVSGNLDMPVNNTIYGTNATSTPIKEFDNLNEFSGNAFTASQTGLYFVTLSILYPQRSATLDHGDGYSAYAYINLPFSPAFHVTKVVPPENGLSMVGQNANAKAVIKLNAGQTISFYGLMYGSTGNMTGATYKINIVRID
ncbi:hypothetical protein GCM10023210_33380 [Chryseobacterium ginsengisoli]|uniref:C1q domain-containing protein n=1 Tax=Chryseobacterium ginsengisoli TaxID=363853 RepID=A0ABP9MJY7_9FLAO